jgi:hypothetical protein
MCPVFVATPGLVNAYLTDLLLTKKRGRATCDEHSWAVADKRRLKRNGPLPGKAAIGATTTYALTGAIGLSRLSRKSWATRLPCRVLVHYSLSV